MRFWKIIQIAALTGVVGCTSPTRSEPDAFKLLARGAINPADQKRFAECLMDGFDKAHWSLTLVAARQQVRSDSIRVEVANGNSVLVSADVKDDGSVELYESKTSTLITTGERETFAACLSKYSKNT